MDLHYPFSVLPLPYGDRALYPALSQQALSLHHKLHYSGCINGLNAVLKDFPAFHNWRLTDLLSRCGQLPFSIRQRVAHNAGGAYNHALYFASLSPVPTAPKGALLSRIEAVFGSLPRLNDLLVRSGLEQFGSGHSYLVCDVRGRLGVTHCPNQAVPLSRGMFPLCALDVWEHAYCMDYQDRREDYLRALVSRLNWAFVQERLAKFQPHGRRV